jgi:hypothetical protein
VSGPRPWRQLAQRVAITIGIVVLYLSGLILMLALSLWALMLTLDGMFPTLYFDHTGRDLARMAEMQLAPAGTTPLRQSFRDGGQGMSNRDIAYAILDLRTTMADPDVAAYYDRELLARGWQRCASFPPNQWCKGNLEFTYKSTATYQSGSPYKIEYGIWLKEYSRRNKRPWPFPP